jgi:hypothetical protein
MTSASAPSKLLVRLLDRTKTIDYGIAFLFGLWPSVLAWLMGVHADQGEYVGYWNSLNVTSQAVILPALLWLLRWSLGRIAPVHTPWPPPAAPPILELLDTQSGKRKVYEALRRWLLSPKLLWGVLLLVLLVHVADMWEMLVEHYYRNTPPVVADRDWAVMFRTGVISKRANLIFDLFNYAVQFAMVLVALLSGVLIIAHNCFFLSRIYQRRRVPDGQEENYFQIDLSDGDRCFGFREANSAFNTQIVLLMAGGVLMLVSRFQHTVTWAQLAENPNSILPDVGQGLLAFGWLLGFLAISMPALVKLLPRLPVWGSARASRTITNYLREFISPERWPFGREPSREEVSALAARFASHAFWPTGNNRASQLFFFAIWIGLVVVFTPPKDIKIYLVASVVLMGVLAYLGRNLIFALLNSSLAYIDSRLVELPPGGAPELRLPGTKLETGVFISYRRADSAAYTGRLYDYLTDHFHSDRIFMDIDDIGAGEKFPEVLDEALRSSSALIVMIGPSWATIDGRDGKPRLMDPNDWVRLEIATALERDVKVFPVLVGGAEMPSSQELPEDLAPLCARNASEISDKRWDYDAKQLMEALRAALDERRRKDG